MKRAHGEGSLLKRPGCQIWYAQYYRDGRQIRVTTGEHVRKKALAVLRKLMADSERGAAPITDVRKLRYADLRKGLLADYVEQGNKSLLYYADGTERIIGLKQLDDFFGYPKTEGPRAININSDTRDRFVEQRLASHVGNAAINRSLACLRRMLRLAHQKNKLQSVPHIGLLKEPPARRGFVKLEEFEELLRLFPTHLQPYVTFLYYCGGRGGEAELIEWPQVDLTRRVIRLEGDQTKNEEARYVPLPSRLVDMLAAVEPKQGRVFDTTNLRKEWQRACAACGLGTLTPVDGKPYDPIYSGLTLHDFRRSAARNLRRAGIPETVIMSIGGWKTRSVFTRYAIVDETDVVDAMRRFESASLNGAKMVQIEGKVVRK